MFLLAGSIDAIIVLHIVFKVVWVFCFVFTFIYLGGAVYS